MDMHSVAMNFSDKEGNERVLITSQTAMRDPKVWGADADEFKLRDLDTYKELSTAWVDQAVHEEQPEHNHACPGKHLSLAMITGKKINIINNSNITCLQNCSEQNF